MDNPAIVVTGGDPVDPHLADGLPSNAYVVAADSGLSHAVHLGLAVDVLIGDMDSVDSEAAERAVASGTVIERHPVDKDGTDLELALRHVAAAGYRSVIVLGGKGGSRLDHFLGNALALGAPEFRDLDIEWRVTDTVLRVVRTSSRLIGVPGDIVSLLPLGGDAVGVTTTGLRWALNDDTLSPGTTRGISNELTRREATVSLREGTLLVIHSEGQP